MTRPAVSRTRTDKRVPVVLCLSGHDPSGGAGVQADIETIAACGAHAASVITCLTEQDSVNVRGLWPQAPSALLSQARTVLADLPVAAFKIGLIGSADLVKAIAEILREHPRVPVVLDPVLAAGGGTELAGVELIESLRRDLLPLTTVLTPNSVEARRLTGLIDLDACAAQLLSWGCQAVLITGTHEQRSDVINTLYSGDGGKENWRWQRLPYEYHGSGCTLASALAAGLARGCLMSTAVREAQRFTWHALEAGFQPGHGQHFPQRVRGERQPCV